MLGSRFLFTRLLLHVFPELGQLVLKALSYNGTRLPRILLDSQRSLSPRAFLTVLEAFQGVSAFVFSDDKHRSLHLQRQFPQLQKSDPGGWLKDEQFFDQTMRDGLSALLGDGPPPHLQSLPSPEPVEELQGLDLHIQGFLLEPLGNIKERVWLASDVLAKSLFADRVVLKPVLSLVLPDQLKVDQFQLIDVFLASSHEVQKLIDVVHSSQHQTHVFVQLGLGDLFFLDAEIQLLLFFSELEQLGFELARVSSDGVRTVEGGKSGALVVLRRRRGREELLGTLADLEVLPRLCHFGRVGWLKLEQIRLGLLLARERMFGEHVPLRTGDGIEEGRVAAGAEIESHLEEPPLEIGRSDYLFADGRLGDINGCLLGHFKFVRLYYVEQCKLCWLYCNKIVMGGRESSTVRWPVISLEQWGEVALARRKVAHGQYKVMINSLTNQRIQQYGLIFQNGEEMEQYLESFVWREREEHIINTRYFQPVKEESFCGSRVYARVYIQHTPYRLSSINDIPLPENLYILCSALLGFQKLHDLIGYFRPNEDMLGIDCEGRVKVWLNSDFSRNYLFGPHYYEGIVEEQQCTEDKMVWEIVNMVEENTAYQHCRIPRLAPFLANKSPLTFSSAYEQVLSYARRFKIAIPKYFVSLVNLLQQRSNLSDSKQSSVSASEAPFKVSESNIRDNRENVVYYMDPSLDSSQAVISNPPREPAQEIKIEHECHEMPADTTGETFIKNSYSISTQVIKPREFQKNPLPKIIFNYSSKDISTPTQEYATSHQASRYTPQFHLPLSRIAEQKFQQSVEQTRRLTYSDNYEDYFLDEELVDDMARYLN